MIEVSRAFNPWTGLFVFALLTVLFGHSPLTREENKYLNPPPEKIEYFHFGFADAMADSLWLRWIQDADVCQTYVKPVVHHRTESATGNPRYKICDVSWSFKMLDATTRLAPKFLMPYMAGASTLAVVVEDYEGATVLYERGLKEYPNDWQLLYRASYHYLFDLADKPKAIELLIRSAENGGPNWLRSLAARISTELGQLELALRSLLEYRKSIEEQATAETLDKLDRRIGELKARLNRPSP